MWIYKLTLDYQIYSITYYSPTIFVVVRIVASQRCSLTGCAKPQNPVNKYGYMAKGD